MAILIKSSRFDIDTIIHVYIKSLSFNVVLIKFGHYLSRNRECLCDIMYFIAKYSNTRVYISYRIYQFLIFNRPRLILHFHKHSRVVISILAYASFPFDRI